MPAVPAGSSVQPLFLSLHPGQPDGGGRRFALLHEPVGRRPERLVVYLHPWAEEMNKSRRMAARQARALADDGMAVLQIDLLGCGDSPGDLSDATWSQWLDDAVAAAGWLQQRHGDDRPLWLWGLRLGAVLAAQAAQRLARCDGLLFWQPSTSGKTVLQQFLRLKTAGQLAAAGSGRPAGDSVRQQLAAGQTLEIAGYRLSPELAKGLEAATLAPLAAPSRPCPVVWLELGAEDAQALSPAGQQASGRWQQAGFDLHAQVVPGPAFWQTVEIEEAPALIDATRAALARHPAGAASAAPAAPPPIVAMATSSQAEAGAAVVERAFTFDCGGDALVGIVALPGGAGGAARPASTGAAQAGHTGMVIVVGGPQYRAGAHRQFTQLARATAAAGWPTLRFDVRGMGDSGGQPRSFEQLDDDLGAAIDALVQQAPEVQRVVLWGLCDGASAALMYLQRRGDRRVGSLCLANPWVRSELGLARTHVKHYYAQRLLQPAFWKKLISGQVGLKAIGGLASTVNQAVAGAADAGPSGDFRQAMLRGWQGFAGQTLLLLSGHDFTAKEFLEGCDRDARWRNALNKPAVQRLDLAEADHTFSGPGDELAVQQAVIAWLHRTSSGLPDADPSAATVRAAA